MRHGQGSGNPVVKRAHELDITEKHLEDENKPKEGEYKDQIEMDIEREMEDGIGGTEETKDKEAEGNKTIKEGTETSSQPDLKARLMASGSRVPYKLEGASGSFMR